jgi:hypothetical protein
MPKGIQINRSKAKKWKVSTIVTTKKGKPIKPHRLVKLAKSGNSAQSARAKRILHAMELEGKP